MFEDSTFESTGSIYTGSRKWMIATFTLNSSILLALILIPLIYPQALPHITSILLMEAPPQPAPRPRPLPQRITPAPSSQLQNGSVLAPTAFPTHAEILRDPGPPSQPIIADLGDSTRPNSSLLNGSSRVTVSQQKPSAPTPVSSGVMNGLLIQKTIPTYPIIAKAARIQGTVVLQATISRSGTIENLRAEGGPAMLQQAAVDAVKSWRYKPYLLDGVPIEVETTVNVVFALQ